ncbi:MAG TPA: hypothetical protein VFZ40_11355 [Pyrinomonadaceae bacterium]
MKSELLRGSASQENERKMLAGKAKPYRTVLRRSRAGRRTPNAGKDARAPSGAPHFAMILERVLGG